MFKVENGPKNAEIYLFDEIGCSIFGGVSAKDFTEAFEKVKDAQKITLRINSPGGSFFDGLAIYNVLKKHKARLTVSVEGLAASAASFIALAGSRVEMAESSFLMIHDAHAVASGNAAGFRKMAENLDEFSGQIAAIYAGKTGKPAEYWRDLMADDYWISSEKAVDLGLVDYVNKDLKVAASLDPERYKYQNTPAALLAPPEKIKALDIERARAAARNARLIT